MQQYRSFFQGINLHVGDWVITGPDNCLGKVLFLTDSGYAQLKYDDQSCASASFLREAGELTTVKFQPTSTVGNLKIGASVTVHPTGKDEDYACTGVVSSLVEAGYAQVKFNPGHCDESRWYKVGKQVK